MTYLCPGTTTRTAPMISRCGAHRPARGTCAISSPGRGVVQATFQCPPTTTATARPTWPCGDRVPGAWYVYGGASVTWGGAGDIPVPADYDGDARTDFGIWRPSTGEWFILTAAGTVMPVHTWGGNGDIPVPADYDNDLKAEVAVWRPSDATYYIRNVGNVQWGLTSDVPVQKRPAYPGYPY